MGMDKELVYLFLYNPMVCQSGWITQSIHKSRKSALHAMETHKSIERQKWEQNFHTDEERTEHPFGKYEDWRVTTTILQD